MSILSSYAAPFNEVANNINNEDLANNSNCIQRKRERNKTMKKREPMKNMNNPKLDAMMKRIHDSEQYANDDDNSDAGNDLSKQHPVIMTIDQDKKHSLNNSYENYAATYNSDQDNYLINLLIKTTIDYFSIKSYDNDKNFALDYYSLSGFKESLQYLKNHCT